MLGFDRGDRVFDTPQGKDLFRSTFEAKVGSLGPYPVKLSLIAVDGCTGAPSWAVCELAQQAHDAGTEYMYQVNDDSFMSSSGWSSKLVDAVSQNNPMFPNFGVAGPTDSANPRILTHSFAHRVHIDIHGRWFPKEFRNWYSDDWFSIVYGDAYTKKPHGVSLQHKHNTVGQRYSQKTTDVKYLMGAVQKGRRRIRRYIMKFYPDLVDSLVFKRNARAEQNLH